MGDSHKFLAHVQNISANNPRKAYAPLVRKIAPVTVIGRQPSRDQQKKNEHFIQPVTSSVNMSAPEVQGENLIVKGHDEYYSLLKGITDLHKEPEVDSFLKFIENIPKACGCVHGALRESAAAMYGQMLPMLQARNPNFFEIIKTTKNVKTLVFKERDIVLLEV